MNKQTHVFPTAILEYADKKNPLSPCRHNFWKKEDLKLNHYAAGGFGFAVVSNPIFVHQKRQTTPFVNTMATGINQHDTQTFEFNFLNSLFIIHDSIFDILFFLNLVQCKEEIL